MAVLQRLADGSLKGIRTATTDANGQLSLDLPGLGVDTVYVLRTAMKHGSQLAYSPDLNQTGNFAFKAGNVRVKTVNGQSGSVLGNHLISAYARMADGTEVYVSNSSSTTDASGLADFDLPELGRGKTYVFKAQNPFDSLWKTSQSVTQAGLINFVIGNKLLNVTVTDGIGNTPLVNQTVNIFQRQADGSLKSFRAATTDVNGQLSLDLPGLGVDTVYVLRTAMKHGSQLAYSPDLNQTGNFAFKAGNVRVKAVNGQSGSVRGNHLISVYARMADGTEVYVSNSSSTTDASGLADFDLPELGSGKTYVFKAQNPFDSLWKTSQSVTQAGLINFVIGNRLLNVTVTDGIGNTPLTNQAVNVLQRLADGSLKGIRTATTDANGQLSLDLPGLGVDTVYVLRTAMKHGSQLAY
ncbi:MAG: hypothetical protein PHH11_17865, partial [Methylomonas sp.]|nr:hypothetical protein [Methylomonas sp.]